MRDKVAQWTRIGAVAAIILVLPGLFLSWPRDDRVNDETSDQAFLMPQAVQTPYRPPTESSDPVATSRAQAPTSITEPPYTPPPFPTLEPPPAATPISYGARKSSPAPNIAWGAESEHGITLWVGRYSDGPTPQLKETRALAHWANPREPGLEHLGIVGRLRLLSMAASPDGRTLAVLLLQTCVALPQPTPPATPWPRHPDVPLCEGDWPRYIYTVDLITDKIQVVPDYHEKYELNALSRTHNIEKLVGWFDNNTFGVFGRQMYTATKDGTSFIERIWPGQSIYDTVFSLSLLPDHKTLFGWVDNEFYFRDAPTGEVRKVGNRLGDPAGSNLVAYDYLVPAPNGKLISYQEPVAPGGGSDGRHYELWVQELATDKIHRLSGVGVWDVQPAWSPDSTRIAFAYTERIPQRTGARWVGQAEMADTNIYIADVTTHTTRKITNFADAHNQQVQWSTNGNLVLSSTAGNVGGGFGLVAVSTLDGKLTPLVSAKHGDQLVRPLLFGAETPGMPGTGSGENR